MRRTFSLLFAGVLAAVLGSALASTAEAAAPMRAVPAAVALPGPGGWGEIFLPLINPSPAKCLDLPGGTSSDHAGLQLFHCHGYDRNGGPQRWAFINQQVVNGFVQAQIVSVASGKCVGVASVSPQPGVRVEQDNCAFANHFTWAVVPDPTNPNFYFQLQLVDVPNLCMAGANNSGNNDTAVVLRPCTALVFPLSDQLQSWQIG